MRSASSRAANLLAGSATARLPCCSGYIPHPCSGSAFAEPVKPIIASQFHFPHWHGESPTIKIDMQSFVCILSVKERSRF